MVQVKHRQARKDIPSAGIKKGDMYYSWRMRSGVGGVKRVSKTPPRPSQLTLSPFKSAWREIIEKIEDLELDEDLYQALQEIAGELRELGESQSESLQNMPDGLQQGDTGQMLETRQQNCETWADALEQLDEPDKPNETEIKEAVERTEGESDADYEARQDEAWETAQENYEGELKNLKDDALAEDPGEE